MSTAESPRLKVALEAGRVDEVLSVLSEAEAPQHRPLRLEALLELGRHDEARQGAAKLRPDQLPEPGAGWLARGRVSLAVGALDAAERALEAAGPLPDALRIEVDRGHAELWRARGDPHRGLDAIRWALDRPIASAGDAHVRVEAARCHLALGRPDRAAELAEPVVSPAREARWMRAAAAGLAVVARARALEGRDHAGAVARRQGVVELLRETSLRWRLAYALLALGDAHRAARDPHAAEQAYQRCLALDVQGHPVSLARLGVAMLAVADGRVDEAGALVDRVQGSEPGPRLRHLAESVRLTTTAGRDPSAFDRSLRAVRQLGRHAVRVDSDVTRSARLAARRWMEAGDPARAVQSRALALLEADRVGDIGAQAQAAQLRRLVEAGAPIPLGPWLLRRRVGRGVAGEVWAATRGPAGPEAAIKIVSGADRAREALQNELVAIASLEHRHISRLLDSGAVDAAAAAADLPEGSPWLATELLEGGTLQPLCGKASWSRCREILLSLLDGLGYAHARGRLHLDLKPANVLLRRDGTPVLVDFGISHAMGTAGRATGTPWSMAPEQFRGAWRDYGPATDLYGFGVLAWMLLTGAPPFDHPEVKQLADLHRRAPLPELRPHGPVPPDLGRWLARLLAKRPDERFTSAPDAARALLGLGPPDASRSAQVVLPLERPPPPPIPRRPPRDGTSDGARGHAVPELVSRREPALVGRGPEREALWEALRDVRSGCRAAVVRGPTGIGTSRLGSWLVEAAVRTGACSALSMVCAPGRDATVVLAERMLGCQGLEGRDLLQRARRRGEALGWNLPGAFGARLAGGGEPLDDSTAAALLAAGLAAVAAERPLVLHVDEAQWAGRLLGVLEPLRRSGAPVLVVLSVDESLAEADTLAALDAVPGATRVRPRTLSDAEMREALQSQLPLAREALDWLVSAADGRPGAGRRLLLSWVGEAILEPASGGYTFRPGLRPEAVPSTPAVQARRLVQALSPERRRAVVALAVTGASVDDARWGGLCARVGARIDADTLAAVREVAVAEGTRWRFGSELARRALASLADEELERAVADIAREEGLGEGPDDDASLERALDELLDALAGARRQGRLASARTLLAEAERVLRRLGVPDGAPRWDALHLQRGVLAIATGDVDEARARLEGLRDGTEAVRARLGLAELALACGDDDEAERWLVEAAPDAADTELEDDWACLRARWLLHAGDAGAAARWLEPMIARMPEVAPSLSAALGVALAGSGRAERAVRLLDAAAGDLLEAGLRRERVPALVALGRALAGAGRGRRAARRWEEALEEALACEHTAGWEALLALVVHRAEEHRVGEVVRLIRRYLHRLPDPVDPADGARAGWVRAMGVAAGHDDGAWRQARAGLSTRPGLDGDAEEQAHAALSEIARAHGRRFP